MIDVPVRERLIIIVDIKDHPSPLAVFGHQVKKHQSGGQTYEIGDQVEVDMLNGVTQLARVKEIFTQDLVSLCNKRYIQVQHGEGVPYDRAISDSLARNPLTPSSGTASRARVSSLLPYPATLRFSPSAVPAETKVSVDPVIDSIRSLQRQQRMQSTISNSGESSPISANAHHEARSLLKEPNKGL